MRRLWLVVAGCAIACGVAAAAPQPTLDAAFEKFWSARSPQEAAKAAQLVVASGISFEDALARLKRGRPYSAEVKRGVIRLQRRTSLGEFFYDLHVPPAYDPARKYQVRIQLHGGVMMRETGEPRTGGGGGGGAAARRRRADLRVAHRVARCAVVEQGAAREPRRDSRQRQTQLQRRREPGRALRHLRWRDRRCTTWRCAIRRPSRASCR